MILGWGFTLFLTFEYICYCVNTGATRHALDEILTHVRQNQNRNMPIPY